MSLICETGSTTPHRIGVRVGIGTLGGTVSNVGTCALLIQSFIKSIWGEYDYVSTSVSLHWQL